MVSVLCIALLLGLFFVGFLFALCFGGGFLFGFHFGLRFALLFGLGLVLVLVLVLVVLDDGGPRDGALAARSDREGAEDLLEVLAFAGEADHDQVAADAR